MTDQNIGFVILLFFSKKAYKLKFCRFLGKCSEKIPKFSIEMSIVSDNFLWLKNTSSRIDNSF